MKSKIIVFLILIFCSFSIHSRESSVEFEIEKSAVVKSNTAEISLSVNEKGKNFLEAANNLNKLLKLLKHELIKLGIDKSFITGRKFHKYPNIGSFNKEQTIKSMLKIKIDDPKYLFDIIKLLETYDKNISIENIDFKSADREIIINELIKEISEIAESRKKAYENAFDVKLQINNITQNTETENKYNRNKSNYSYSSSYDFDDSNLDFPEKKIKIKLILTYQLSKN